MSVTVITERSGWQRDSSAMKREVALSENTKFEGGGSGCYRSCRRTWECWNR